MAAGCRGQFGGGVSLKTEPAVAGITPFEGEYVYVREVNGRTLKHSKQGVKIGGELFIADRYFFFHDDV